MSTFKGFSSVQLRRPKKSAFDLTHDKRMTTGFGRITPCVVMECVPSDQVRGSTEILARLAPLLAPIYDQLILYVHFFFIPNRLLWDEWEEFITGGRLGVGVDPVAAPIPPYMDIGAMLADDPEHFDAYKLPEYMGLPIFNLIDPDPADWNGKTIDLMPFAAYQLVWSEYYRDRNFISDDVAPTNLIPLPSGPMAPNDAQTLIEFRQRAFAPDYFTSALPFTQRGDQVLMPVSLGGEAPLYVSPTDPGSVNSNIKGEDDGIDVQYNVAIDNTLPTVPSQLWVKGEDFDGTSTSINDFRSAYALQVWLERNAVGGSRYTESTQAHFGIKPQDSRLQRPEYIGGGRINVKIAEVVSTAWAQTDGVGQVPQANMAGHGVTYGDTNTFRYFCTEHGFIMGFVTIMSPRSYNGQGVPRMFRRRTFLDYPWPTFATLGEQPVYNYELYATPASLTPDADGEEPVFGYQSRYSDWKWMPTQNAGDFKGNLLFWTLATNFADAPALSQSFVETSVEHTDRIFAVPAIGSQNFWLYCHNKIHVIRPLPYFGTPNTMGFS